MKKFLRTSVCILMVLTVALSLGGCQLVSGLMGKRDAECYPEEASVAYPDKYIGRYFRYSREYTDYLTGEADFKGALAFPDYTEIPNTSKIAYVIFQKDRLNEEESVDMAMILVETTYNGNVDGTSMKMYAIGFFDIMKIGTDISPARRDDGYSISAYDNVDVAAFNYGADLFVYHMRFMLMENDWVEGYEPIGFANKFLEMKTWEEADSFLSDISLWYSISGNYLIEGTETPAKGAMLWGIFAYSNEDGVAKSEGSSLITTTATSIKRGILTKIDIIDANYYYM